VQVAGVHKAVRAAVGAVVAVGAGVFVLVATISVAKVVGIGVLVGTRVETMGAEQLVQGAATYVVVMRERGPQPKKTNAIAAAIPTRDKINF